MPIWMKPSSPRARQRYSTLSTTIRRVPFRLRMQGGFSENGRSQRTAFLSISSRGRTRVPASKFSHPNRLYDLRVEIGLHAVRLLNRRRAKNLVVSRGIFVEK